MLKLLSKAFSSRRKSSPSEQQSHEAAAFFERPSRLEKGVPTITDHNWVKQRGWRYEANQDSWLGKFQIGSRRTIEGRISMSSGYPKVAFHRPPNAIARHKCVHLRKDAWQELHEHGVTRNRTVRGLISAVEIWLQQTLQPRQLRSAW